MPVDFSTEHGQKVRQLLETEISVWLTTVSASGEPNPNPVWFIWDDDSFVILTSPESVRVRNIKANPKVSIAFSGDHELHKVTVFNGIAEFDDSVSSLLDYPAYLEKYQNEWEPSGITPEQASEVFTTAIRIRPDRLRGFFPPDA